MRTLLVIAGGIILWAVIQGLTKLLHQPASNSWIPTSIFAIIWLMVTSWNVWVGITQAGYTFLEELPIFLLTYLLPVTVAVLIQRKSRAA
ncbi:hypothetical protein [Marinobacter shengliensis]|uniref:Lycopene cyclase domain-containing protein n=1 Tax=Marinobacter shengliensis TaxID=1389223 RepID=A0ABV4W4A9_9GAMM|tara:strand:+ start:147 stop:416 length:270 start_codon:yes stop_codon:yes gene_type:complete